MKPKLTILSPKGAKNSPPVLGERELMLLEILWQTEELSAQQIHAFLPASTCISVNTVQSTIERLYRKELVERKKRGRQFYYRAVRSQEDIIQQLIQGIASNFRLGDTAPMISGFIGFLRDAQMLDAEQEFKAQLQTLIKEIDSDDV